MELTIEEIEAKLEHYVPVPREYFDRIPNGSHIRYVRKGDEPFETRFRSGGFVMMKWVSKNEGPNKGRQMIRLSMNPASKSTGDSDSFVIILDEIEAIYKKYSYESFIEFVTFSRIIADLKEQIDALNQSRSDAQ